MAIDFMILPLSRYISGDFVTPAMRLAWDQGVPYTILGPAGRRDLPPGEPFGGPDAAARRSAIQAMLREDLERLPPPVSSALWDENSEAAPRFHRVDPASYRALLETAARSDASSGHRFWKRKAALHVTATLFLPCELPEVFAMSSPFERMTGSVKRALAELEAERWPAAAHSAREVLTDALRDADALRLPLVVDF